MAQIGEKAFTRAERAFIHSLCDMLEEMEFKDVRTVALLQRAGFSRGAFYGRFRDKYDFAESIVCRTGQIHTAHLIRHDELRRGGAAAEDPQVVDNSEALFRFVYEYRRLYDLIIQHRLSARDIELFLFGRDGKAEEIRDDYAGFLDCMSLYSSLLYVIYWRRFGYARFTPREMAVMSLAYTDNAFRHYWTG